MLLMILNSNYLAPQHLWLLLLFTILLPLLLLLLLLLLIITSITNTHIHNNDNDNDNNTHNHHNSCVIVSNIINIMYYYTQSPLEDSRLFGPSPWKILRHYLWTNGFLSNPAPGDNLLSGNHVMETGCSMVYHSIV